MKSKTWLRYIYAAAIAAVFTLSISAQTRTNQIYRPCAASIIPASVRVTLAGAVTVTPCTGQTITLSGAITASNGITMPVGQSISSTAGPLLSSTAGPGVTVGGSGSGTILLTSSTATWNFTDFPGGNVYLSLNSSGLNLGFGTLILQTTNTAGGTTGAQTINKASGTVNFAAAATSLVVTNSLVTATSKVFAVVQTNDATAVIKNVTPAAGSFTIRLNAAATAETAVAFFVVN